MGFGLEFKTNTSQKCFVAGDFVFIKKRKKLWNIGTIEHYSNDIETIIPNPPCGVRNLI